MASSNSFARRSNENTTIDSICTKCYQTIATADRSDHPGQMSVTEHDHLCDPNGEFNSERGHFHQPVSRPGA